MAAEPVTTETTTQPKPRRYSAERSHPSYSIEPCPHCGFPEADGGYCPDCGKSAPVEIGIVMPWGNLTLTRPDVSQEVKVQ